jgi:hypothetical protein
LIFKSASWFFISSFVMGDAQRQALDTLAKKIERHVAIELGPSAEVEPSSASGFFSVGLERAMGIGPTSRAWEAPILPLNYARSTLS